MSSQNKAMVLETAGGGAGLPGDIDGIPADEAGGRAALSDIMHGW